MDILGVIVGVLGFDKFNVGELKEVCCSLFSFRVEGDFVI